MLLFDSYSCLSEQQPLAFSWTKQPSLNESQKSLAVAMNRHQINILKRKKMWQELYPFSYTPRTEHMDQPETVQRHVSGLCIVNLPNSSAHNHSVQYLLFSNIPSHLYDYNVSLVQFSGIKNIEISIAALQTMINTCNTDQDARM